MTAQSYNKSLVQASARLIVSGPTSRGQLSIVAVVLSILIGALTIGMAQDNKTSSVQETVLFLPLKLSAEHFVAIYVRDMQDRFRKKFDKVPADKLVWSWEDSGYAHWQSAGRQQSKKNVDSNGTGGGGFVGISASARSWPTDINDLFERDYYSTDVDLPFADYKKELDGRAKLAAEHRTVLEKLRLAELRARYAERILYELKYLRKFDHDNRKEVDGSIKAHEFRLQ